jgi:hypothetical protein
MLVTVVKIDTGCATSFKYVAQRFPTGGAGCCESDWIDVALGFPRRVLKLAVPMMKSAQTCQGEHTPRPLGVTEEIGQSIFGEVAIMLMRLGRAFYMGSFGNSNFRRRIPENKLSRRNQLLIEPSSRR